MSSILPRGTQIEQERLFDRMGEMIGNGSHLEAILLPHNYADHVGAVNPVSRRYQLPVRVHPLTCEHMQDRERKTFSALSTLPRALEDLKRLNGV
ncbi:MAG: hypothetical protein ACREUU_06870 [Gammaproteobacteria bacterium]